MEFSVRNQRVSSVVLIGMPGVGKTSLGKAFSKAHGLTFLDTDHVLIDAIGEDLESLIQREGADAFNAKEKETLLALPAYQNHVIGTGGSVVYSADVMAHLQSFAVILFLKDRLSRIAARIPNLHTRGIVGLGSGGLAELYEERLPLYERYADATVTFDGGFHPKRLVQKMTDAVTPFRVTQKEQL